MAEDTKNVSILEEEEVEVKHRVPPKKEQDVLNAIMLKFRISSDDRNQNFEYFDGDNLIDYINDSVKRFVTNIDSREDIEDWQARVNDQFTHNKVITILGKVAQVLPIAQIAGRGDEDMRKGHIATNLYEYSEEIDEYEQFIIEFLQEAIVKGTAIGYEGHEKKTQMTRTIVSGSEDKIKVKEEEKKTNRLYAEVVKLEDFYPSSVGIKKIEDMPYCFWRNVIPEQQFKQDYAAFDRVDLVEAMQSFAETENRPFYLDYVSDDVREGNIEVLKYYNQDTDEYIITANGVWLNPVKVGDDELVISPLPFNHKELPFFHVIFESYGSDFFYGKSLPDKLKSMQDVLNVLTNMLLDQSFLTIFPPILTSGFDSIEDDYLRPGRRTPVDTQGLALKDQYMTLDMGVPSGWHQFILQYTRTVMEESSIDKVSSGQAGAGDRTTAQEIRVAAEGVAAILGLFGRFIRGAVKRKALLRTKNIFQFWTDPEFPIIQQVLNEEGAKDFNKAFNIFKIDNGILSGGKRGQKIIEMFKDKKDLPTKPELKARATIFEAETKKKIEIIAIPASYIQQLDFDVKLIANPKTENTKDADKALHLEKVKIYLSFFPELVDKEELAVQTAEIFGDDPTKVFKEQIFSDQVAPGAVEGQQPNLPGTLPQGNASENIVRGLGGGEANANQLNQIA